MKVVFATNNENKLNEVRDMLPFFNVVGLKDIGCTEEIAETATTLEGNAKLKANYVREKYGYNCFSDDTGLEVEALNGEPGVYSARYAGEPTNAENNMNKLLDALKNENNRKARFRTVIALSFDNENFLFDGVCEGEILSEKKGTDGFGYDPIFKPLGHNKTFAEMTLEEKGSISHRGIAIEKLVSFLETIQF